MRIGREREKFDASKKARKETHERMRMLFHICRLARYARGV